MIRHAEPINPGLHPLAWCWRPTPVPFNARQFARGFVSCWAKSAATLGAVAGLLHVGGLL